MSINHLSVWAGKLPVNLNQSTVIMTCIFGRFLRNLQKQFILTLFPLIMKFRFILPLFLAMLFITSCQETEKAKTDKASIIGKPELILDNDLQSPEVLWAYGRLSDIQVSPDGGKLLYGVSYYSVEQNKGNRELYSMNPDGSDLKQLTHSPKSEFNALWRPDGEKIGFLSSESGSVQLYQMNPDGTGITMITDIEGGVGGFSYAPDMKHILFIKDVETF